MHPMQRSLINHMLVEYKDRRSTLFTANAPCWGAPIRASWDEWHEYQAWVIAWIDHGKALRDNNQGVIE